jgi:hypothetical protein
MADGKKERAEEDSAGCPSECARDAADPRNHQALTLPNRHPKGRELATQRSRERLR